MQSSNQAAPGTVGGYEGDDEVADRAAIHALLMAYGEILDRRDFEDFAALFGDDGVYMLGGKESVGPAIAEAMQEHYRTDIYVAQSPNFHMFSNEVITFDGPNRALSTSICVYMISNGGFPQPGPSARYRDELVKKDGRWFFARRRFEGFGKSPAAG